MKYVKTGPVVSKTEIAIPEQNDHLPTWYDQVVYRLAICMDIGESAAYIQLYDENNGIPLDYYGIISDYGVVREYLESHSYIVSDFTWDFDEAAGGYVQFFSFSVSWKHLINPTE